MRNYIVKQWRIGTYTVSGESAQALAESMYGKRYVRTNGVDPELLDAPDSAVVMSEHFDFSICTITPAP